MTSYNFKIEQIKTLPELYSLYAIYQHIYPDMSKKTFQTNVSWMFKNNIKFVCVKDKTQPIAVSAYWYGIRLHSGKYLQIDSLVVLPDYRNRKIGTKIIKYLEAIAKKQKAHYYVLDVYTNNHQAIKLYALDNFKIRGYHLMKKL